EAPYGTLYRQGSLEAPDGPGRFAPVVGGRVLHHVDPLYSALDKLAALAPLLILDEFALNHMDQPTIDWYESHHRLLVAAGQKPKGPADLAEWRTHHTDLHTYEVLRAAI